jgi:hypothetical protein
MDTLIHADIFFFVTTIALVVVTIGICIALFYVIKILRDVRAISETARVESKLIAGDVEKLRNNIRVNGLNFPALFRFFRGIFRHKKMSDGAFPKLPFSHIINLIFLT